MLGAASRVCEILIVFSLSIVYFSEAELNCPRLLYDIHTYGKINLFSTLATPGNIYLIFLPSTRPTTGQNNQGPTMKLHQRLREK
jgi:hypothetical protein